MTEMRTPTAVDALADRYLDESVSLNPIEATYLGIAGHDAELPAYDPDWHAQVSELRRRTLEALDAVEPTDANDRITIAALREDLAVAEELRQLGADESELRNIASPLQNIRDVFDLMPAATGDHWAVIAQRLAAVPSAVDGYIESLRSAAARGHVSARRQVEAGIKQCADYVGVDGFFPTFARHAAAEDGSELPASVRADLERNAAVAATAYEHLAAFLGDELVSQAPQTDAIGRERYALHSRSFLGSEVDLEETYEWGQQELARIDALMVETAAQIKPGATLDEVFATLDADPGRMLSGTQALKEWMQRKSDEAVAALADTHFDIPEPIRRLECRIAPTHDGVIYYTGPSEDLVTRPGRMWWSVPEGVTDFGTWRELTTVYHEGVPGHHLQVAQTAYRSSTLNRWRRMASWVSGHGEGWALYSERLMADLGFLDDPGDFLGMLDAQSMRAARVVLDIGIHCGLPAPAEVGGGDWTYDKGWRFLAAHANLAEGFLRFELDRYLGWPGQAPSYKVGERLWLQLREEARARAGDAFDLKTFHRRALDIGSVGLDVLRAAVLDEI
ncbi:MAG: hypothetical protein QOC66_294 [Pseudonocardiales bacterium]|nr:hypothetical protein [Pseudonocardiales bacterium]